jgi:hypothetical protein
MGNMSKKEVLEMLIRSYGLAPLGVRPYRTRGRNGQATGWKGEGVDWLGDAVIDFREPDGFHAAVYSVLERAHQQGLVPERTHGQGL